MYQPVRAFYQSGQNQHIEHELADVLPDHRDGGQRFIQRRTATGQERRVDHAGQHNDRALHAHADVAFQERLPGARGCFSRERCQRQGRNGSVNEDTNQSGMDSRKLTSSMASTILSGSVAVVEIAEPMPPMTVLTTPPQIL